MNQPTTHERSQDNSNQNYADPALQAKIQRLEQLPIRPAITVYQPPEE